MKFENFTRHLAGSLDVTIDGRAIHQLWGAGSGPQDAQGVVEANWSMIASIAFDKVTGGDLEPDNTVLITEADLDGDVGEDLFRLQGEAEPVRGPDYISEEEFWDDPMPEAKEVRELTVERFEDDITNDDIPW